MTTETSHLTAEDRRLVDERLAPLLPQLSPSRAEAAARRLAIEVDQAGAVTGPVRHDERGVRVAVSPPAGRESARMAQLDGLGLAAFNSLHPEEAESTLMACCSSRRWARLVAAGRPYASVDAVCRTADSALHELAERDVDEALDGHPRIGERPSAGHSAWSNQEQAGVSNAAADVHAALGEANRAYEQRFGHVYLVCATGKSAEELLATLNDRLSNDPATERRVVRTELAKINRIRLERMLAEGEL